MGPIEKLQSSIPGSLRGLEAAVGRLGGQGANGTKGPLVGPIERLQSSGSADIRR